MTDNRMARIKITPELVRKELHMPEDHEIVGAAWDFESESLLLYVVGPDLPLVKEREEIPTAIPTITRKENYKTVKYEWEWGEFIK